jgi:hypothetical protein
MPIVKFKFKETATLEDVIFLLNHMGISIDTNKVDLKPFAERENIITEEVDVTQARTPRILKPGE